MAYQLDGNSLPLDVAFKTSDGTQYPANWLRLSTAEEKKAIGITEISDPVNYDGRFYNSDGSAKSLVDVDATYYEDDPDGTYKKGDLIKNPDGTQLVYYGVKTNLINAERGTVNSLLTEYDWYVTRKSEKGTAIPDTISTYRDAVLVTLYSATYDSDGKFVKHNMTQYPSDPNRYL